jgi:hypothetical protein
MTAMAPQGESFTFRFSPFLHLSLEFWGIAHIMELDLNSPIIILPNSNLLGEIADF